MRRIRALCAIVLMLSLALPAAAEPMATVEPDVRIDTAGWEIDPGKIPADALPGAQGISIESEILDGDGAELPAYARAEAIAFGAPDEFTSLAGITTFRGDNYRDGASYGTIGAEPTQMSILWSNSIGGIDKWTGVGWTGQCSIVRWPEETRKLMNLYPDKKDKGRPHRSHLCDPRRAHLLFRSRGRHAHARRN